MSEDMVLELARTMRELEAKAEAAVRERAQREQRGELFEECNEART